MASAVVQVRRLTGPRSKLSLGEEGFPAALQSIPHPPKELYVVGDPGALREGLAVVGARKATPYGKNAASLFAGMAARHGVVVVSGGAKGCDAAAHRAALEAGGTTVCFLGGGCDMPYPVENFDLFQQVVDAGGAVVSEHPWTFPPKPYTFRTRNRLIAGLAKATLIVEAGLPSGTFSTADEALSANKDVLVVPGSIFSATSKGANRLLHQGATPVVDEETFDMLLQSLFPHYLPNVGQQAHLPLFGNVSAASSVATRKLEGLSLEVFRSLEANPMRMDEVIEKCSEGVGQGPQSIVKAIAELEAKGVVERYPDGRFGPR